MRAAAGSLGRLGLLLTLLSPRPAHAYVSRLSSTGSPYVWRPASVGLAGYLQGIPSMTADDIQRALGAAVGAWTRDAPALAGCSYLELIMSPQPPVDAVPDPKYDAINNATFRSDAWETRCTPDPTGQPVCHDPAALAVTTLFAARTGQILDADIEVNAVDFAWADLDLTASDGTVHDLQNALAHEVGHFVGLDHTCYVYSRDGVDDPAHPRPADQNGAPIPDCADASPEVQATTMFPSATGGDVSKRDLEPDDIAGLCALYPPPFHDRFAPDDGCAPEGCAVAGPSRGGGPGARRPAGARAVRLAASATAMLLLLRGRRRRRSPACGSAR